MDLGAFLKKCFKLLLQGGDPVARVGTYGTEKCHRSTYDYLLILILDVKSYTNVAWYHLAPDLAVCNRTCPMQERLFISSSNFFSDIPQDKAFNYVAT